MSVHTSVINRGGPVTEVAAAYATMFANKGRLDLNRIPRPSSVVPSERSLSPSPPSLMPSASRSRSRSRPRSVMSSMHQPFQLHTEPEPEPEPEPEYSDFEGDNSDGDGDGDGDDGVVGSASQLSSPQAADDDDDDVDGASVLSADDAHNMLGELTEHHVTMEKFAIIKRIKACMRRLGMDTQAEGAVPTPAASIASLRMAETAFAKQESQEASATFAIDGFSLGVQVLCNVASLAKEYVGDVSDIAGEMTEGLEEEIKEPLCKIMARHSLTAGYVSPEKVITQVLVKRGLTCAMSRFGNLGKAFKTQVIDENPFVHATPAEMRHEMGEDAEDDMRGFLPDSATTHKAPAQPSLTREIQAEKDILERHRQETAAAQREMQTAAEQLRLHRASIDEMLAAQNQVLKRVQEQQLLVKQQGEMLSTLQARRKYEEEQLLKLQQERANIEQRPREVPEAVPAAVPEAVAIDIQDDNSSDDGDSDTTFPTLIAGDDNV